MAEDNTSDMEMEDILSSIKDILEDAEVEQKSQEISDAPIIDEQEEVDLEDILELSPDMMINNEPIIEEINIESELSEVKVPELAEEPVLETLYPEVEIEEPLVQDVSETGLEDFESDPFIIEQEEVVEDAVVEPEPESEPVFVAEPEPEPIPFVEPEPIKEETESDAVDISANIINNFTKMFSNNEQPKEEPVSSISSLVEPIKVIGDGDKTIEDVVANVIKQIIGNEVAQNWREQADYDSFAKQVIVEQTKNWLDINLANIVETIVKQEIERVMAKVGNNQ